jgi:SAM-dependent methyltransferase
MTAPGIGDTPYVPTFQPAQAPPHLALALALAGYRWDAPREALSVIDLGCGRGGVALALAAANPGWRVTGLDYSAAHVAEARAIAAEAGLANAQFLDLDLSALDEATAARLLPEADVITAHGLWSWVADPVREGMLAVLRSRLRPGGLAMVSYNTVSGWAKDLSLVRLIRSLAADRPGTAVERVTQAFELALALRAAGAPALQDSEMLRPFASSGAAGIRRAARYLAHEYLAEPWRPEFPRDVAAAMAGAGLGFVAQARLWAQLPALMLTPAQRDAVAALPPGEAARLAPEVFEHQALRQDIFQRGAPVADAAALGATRLALCAMPGNGMAGVRTPVGEVALPAAALRPVLAALSERPQPVEALAALSGGIPAAELAAVLVATGVAAPAWRDLPGQAARDRAARFNLVALRRYGPETEAARQKMALAVPLLGAALPLGTAEAAVALRLARERPGHSRGTRPGGAPDVAGLARGLVAPGAPPARRAQAEAHVREVLADRLAAWRAMGLV